MVTLVTGIPSSGKTTYCTGKNYFSCDEWVKKYTNTPDIEEAGQIFLSAPNGLKDMAQAIQEAYIPKLFIETPLIIKKTRIELVSFLHNNGIADIKCVYLLCPLYVALKRNESRKTSIHKEIIYTAFMKQEYPTASEGFTEVKLVVNG